MPRFVTYNLIRGHNSPMDIRLKSWIRLKQNFDSQVRKLLSITEWLNGLIKSFRKRCDHTCLIQNFPRICGTWLSEQSHTRCVRKVSNLCSYLRVGGILRYPDRGILRSSSHLIEPHAPSGAFTSQSSPRTQILEWSSGRASHYSESSRCRRTAFLWAPFSILGTSKSRRELCRNRTEAGEAVQSCVSPKIAAQGSMNALARYRGEEASHRLTRNAVVFSSRHHAIFSELQRNILCWSSDLLEQIRNTQHPHNRKK